MSYYQKHREEIRLKQKLYYNTHKEKLLSDAKEYYKNHYEEKRAKSTQYRKEHHDEICAKRRAAYKQRRNTDEMFLFAKQVRHNIRQAFTRKFRTKVGRTEEILGCSIIEFKEYIASKFQDGMTFDNYGQWHLDHIIPLASAKTIEDIIRLCHYTNYQPLWAFDNISKGSKIIT